MDLVNTKPKTKEQNEKRYARKPKRMERKTLFSQRIISFYKNTQHQ